MSREGADEALRMWLFAAMDKHRGQFNPAELLREATAAGHEPSVALLGRILDLHGHWAGGTHPVVRRFIRGYLAGRGANGVLDPAASSPLLLLDLVDGDIAASGTGWVLDWELRLVAEEATELLERPVVWELPWPLPPHGNPVTDFPDGVDLIVSSPPFGLKKEGLTYPGPDGDIEVREELGAHALLTAIHLSDEGEALVLAPPRFLWSKEPRGARAALAELGLHVHAAIELKDGLRNAVVHPTLLSIRKTPAEGTWVAQLRPDMDADDLAHRWRDRATDSTAPELGRIAEWSEFDGFAPFRARERLTLMTKRSGHPNVALADLVIEDIKGPSATDKGLVSDPPDNTVFLPTYASGTAHDNTTAEGLKPKGYVPLSLDPARVHAGYLAAFFNRPLGRTLRESWSSSFGPQNLRIGTLRDAHIPLPPLDIQTAALRELQRVRELRIELTEAEAQLVDRPGDARAVGRQLERLGQSDPLKPWMEDLPFPLASVLYRARADADESAKLDHLLRFFEASAEFFAAVLLSGFYRQPELLGSERLKWGKDPGIAPSLEIATFGGWTKLGAAMAGSARRAFTGDGDATTLPEALGLRSEAFAEFVASKKLWKLLDAQVARRNTQSHRGIRNLAAEHSLVTDLEGAVTELYEVSSDALAEVRLIRPREGAYRKGVNKYRRAQFLTGHAEPFPEEPLQSIPQLEADELYLVDDVDPDESIASALKLLPLVTLREAPVGSASAIYFYNRIENGQAKYVSHHFEEEAERHEDSADLGELLRVLADGPEAE